MSDNYAVVSDSGQIISWHDNGNAAIAARDTYDAANGNPRFTSRVLTSGQVRKGITNV